MTNEVYLPCGPAGKENNSLQFDIVEEIVKGPDAAIFTKWIR